MSSGRSVAEVLCGAMRLFFGPNGSETELGLTMEGSVMRIETEHADITTEEYGIAPIKRVHRGERIQVDAILKQADNAQLLIAVLGSTQSTGPTVRQWRFGAQAGNDLSGSSFADRLRLAPITNANAATDESDSFIFHIAVPEPLPIEMRFQNEEARLVGIRFHVLIDDSKSDGNLLGQWKEDSA